MMCSAFAMVGSTVAMTVPAGIRSGALNLSTPLAPSVICVAPLFNVTRVFIVVPNVRVWPFNTRPWKLEWLTVIEIEPSTVDVAAV